ncbi:hypothetical protein H632_c1331p1 [Helicosporidium sp. ATCC 50920]|nr:hypothetical protein H632_c1331p1 [Helicosporidium sp. ATCC 50920]|eukprot:KDD74414.1 hypothetical protein H632_c1331p1 [Helicosporidium sp. ATCC 50920]
MRSSQGAVVAVIKLSLPAGKANPAPPVGPALGSKGVNIMSFCKQYNEATSSQAGRIIPAEITDKSFTFVLKTPPASFLLKQAAGVAKGAAAGSQKAVGSVTAQQVREIAEAKLADMNCTSLEAAALQIRGTARNMGIQVVD